MTGRKPGRKAVDGAAGLTARINVVLTEEHKKKLEAMATNGISPWVRRAIDSAWEKQLKGNRK